MSVNKRKLENIISMVMSDLNLIHEQVCHSDLDFAGNPWTAATVNVAYNVCRWKSAIFEEMGDLHLYREWEEMCEAIKGVMAELAKKGDAA